MTLPIARELARDGIRVMAIAPGLMQTAMFDGLTEAAVQSLSASEKRYFKRYAQRHSTQRDHHYLALFDAVAELFLGAESDVDRSILPLNVGGDRSLSCGTIPITRIEPDNVTACEAETTR